MGFTRYFTKTREFTQAEFDKIAADARKIIDIAPSRGIPLTGCRMDPLPIVTADEIRLNGDGADAHETFLLCRGGTGFDFCKTNRKPYDAVVSAIMRSIKYHAPGVVEISSDGGNAESLALSIYEEAVG